MINRIIYESASSNNVYLKNMQTDIHQKRLNEIRSRRNKYLDNFKLYNSNSNSSILTHHKRSYSPFDLSISYII